MAGDSRRQLQRQRRQRARRQYAARRSVCKDRHMVLWREWQTHGLRRNTTQWDETENKNQSKIPDCLSVNCTCKDGPLVLSFPSIHPDPGCECSVIKGATQWRTNYGNRNSLVHGKHNGNANVNCNSNIHHNKRNSNHKGKQSKATITATTTSKLFWLMIHSLIRPHHNRPKTRCRQTNAIKTTTKTRTSTMMIVTMTVEW